jgi:hypothetical protein
MPVSILMICKGIKAKLITNKFAIDTGMFGFDTGIDGRWSMVDVRRPAGLADDG